MVACCGSVVFCAEDFLLRCRAGPQQLPPTPLSGDELSLPQPSKCPCCSCSPSETLSERLVTGHSILCAHRTCLLRSKASYQDLSFSRWAAHHSLDFLQGLCPPLRPTMHGYLKTLTKHTVLQVKTDHASFGRKYLRTHFVPTVEIQMILWDSAA